MAKKRKKTSLKCLSLALAMMVGATQTGLAMPGAGVSIAPGGETPGFLQIEIPHDIASIEDIYEAPAKPDPKLILHVQNIHGNYESQIQIKKLLEYLYQRYGFKLIFAEGAVEKLDPEILKFFPDKERNLKLADLMAKHGDLTGIEYFLMDGPKDVEAIGIENAELYRLNYEAFKKVYRGRDQSDHYLELFEGKLETLASRIFTANTRRLLSEWRKFEAGQRDFLPFVKRLAIDARNALGLDLESLFSQVEWPQITRLLALQSMEQELNAKAAAIEKDRLVQFLTEKKISHEVIQAIQKLHEKKITMTRLDQNQRRLEDLPRYLFERLVEEAGPKGFRFQDYPAFSLWAGHLILQHEMDSKALFEEIENVFEKILNELTVNEREKNLLELSRDEILLKKLLHLELTRTEWDRVEYRKDWMALASMQGRLRKLSEETSPAQALDESLWRKLNRSETSGVRQLLNTGYEFYHFARRRDAVFYETIEKQMAAAKTDKAVLVTGGFHTDGLMELFRRQEINCSVLMPRVAGDFDNSGYIASMQENRQPNFDITTLEAILRSQSAGAIQSQGGNLDYLYDLIARYATSANKGKAITAAAVAARYAGSRAEVRKSIADSGEQGFPWDQLEFPNKAAIRRILEPVLNALPLPADEIEPELLTDEEWDRRQANRKTLLVYNQLQEAGVTAQDFDAFLRAIITKGKSDNIELSANVADFLVSLGLEDDSRTERLEENGYPKWWSGLYNLTGMAAVKHSLATSAFETTVKIATALKAPLTQLILDKKAMTTLTLEQIGALLDEPHGQLDLISALDFLIRAFAADTPFEIKELGHQKYEISPRSEVRTAETRTVDVRVQGQSWSVPTPGIGYRVWLGQKSVYVSSPRDFATQVEDLVRNSLRSTNFQVRVTEVSESNGYAFPEGKPVSINSRNVSSTDSDSIQFEIDGILSGTPIAFYNNGPALDRALQDAVNTLTRSEVRSVNTDVESKFKDFIRVEWAEKGRDVYTVQEFRDLVPGVADEEILRALRNIDGEHAVTKDIDLPGGKKRNIWFSLHEELTEAGRPTGKLVTFIYAHKHGILHAGSHVFVFTRNPQTGKLVALVTQVRRGLERKDDRLDASSTGHGKIGHSGVETAIDEAVDELGWEELARPDRYILLRNRTFDQDLWRKTGKKSLQGKEPDYDAQGKYVSASSEEHNEELIRAYGVWMGWDEYLALQENLVQTSGTAEVSKVEARTLDEILTLMEQTPANIASGLAAYLHPKVKAGFLDEVMEKVVAPNDVEAVLMRAEVRDGELPSSVEPGQVRQYLSVLTNQTFPRSELRTSRRDFLKTSVAAVLGLTLAPTVPTQIQAQQHRQSPMVDQAKATVLGMLSLIEEKTGLVVDKATIGAGDRVLQVRNNADFMKTSPTNIGLGIVSVIIARDQGWISKTEANDKLAKMIATLEKMDRMRGFWFNWYNLASLDAQGSPRVTLNRFLSSVDNANLTAGLMVLREAVEGTPLAGRVQKLLDAQDWNFFYNKKTGLINHGYDVAKQSYSEYDYGTFNTEARLLSFISVLQGVDQKAWDGMSRAVLADKSGKILVAASWGGSLFETLFADIFMNAPGAIAQNNRDMVQIHIDKAKELGYKIWGWSPALDTNDIYTEAAVPEIGARGGGKGYPVGAVSPYSSLLAARYVDPAILSANLANMQALNRKVYSPNFGYRDVIDPKTGRGASDILGLDKGIEVAGFDMLLQSAAKQPGTAEKYFWRYLERVKTANRGKALLNAETQKIADAKKEYQAGKATTTAKFDWVHFFLEDARLDGGEGAWDNRSKIQHNLVKDPDWKKDDFSERVFEISYDVTVNGSFWGTFHKQRPAVDPANRNATHVVIPVRGVGLKGSFTTTFKVELKRGGRVVQEIIIKDVTDQWQELAYPLKAGIGAIDEVVTVFENIRVDAKKGTVRIADIALGKKRSEVRNLTVEQLKKTFFKLTSQFSNATQSNDEAQMQVIRQQGRDKFSAERLGAQEITDLLGRLENDDSFLFELVAMLDLTEALPLLERTLLNSKDPRQEIFLILASHALGHITDPEAVDILIRGLEQNINGDSLQQAVLSLGLHRTFDKAREALRTIAKRVTEGQPAYQKQYTQQFLSQVISSLIKHKENGITGQEILDILAFVVKTYGAESADTIYFKRRFEWARENIGDSQVDNILAGRSEVRRQAAAKAAALKNLVTIGETDIRIQAGTNNRVVIAADGIVINGVRSEIRSNDSRLQRVFAGRPDLVEEVISALNNPDRIPSALQPNVNQLLAQLRGAGTKQRVPAELSFPTPVGVGIQVAFLNSPAVNALGTLYIVAGTAGGIFLSGVSLGTLQTFAGAFANQNQQALRQSLDLALRGTVVTPTAEAGAVLAVVRLPEDFELSKLAPTLEALMLMLQAYSGAHVRVVIANPKMPRGTHLTPKQIDERLNIGASKLRSPLDKRFGILMTSLDELNGSVQQAQRNLAREMGKPSVLDLGGKFSQVTIGTDGAMVRDIAALSLADLENNLGMVISEIGKVNDLAKGALNGALQTATGLRQQVQDLLNRRMGFYQFDEQAVLGLMAKLNEALASIRTAISA